MTEAAITAAGEDVAFPLFDRIVAAAQAEGRRLCVAAEGGDKPIFEVAGGFDRSMLAVDVEQAVVSVSGWGNNEMPGYVWDCSGFWCPVDCTCSALKLADLLEQQPELVAQAAVQHAGSMRKATAALEQVLSLLYRWTIVAQTEFFADVEIDGCETDWELMRLAETTGPVEGRLCALFEIDDAFEWLCRRRDAMQA
jgi:hypothetical protein